MNRATKEIFHFANQVDELKNFLMNKRLTDNDIRLVLGNDKISAIVLYYVFLNIAKEKAFKIELETIDDLVKKHSEYNAERLKAMTSILKTEDVFTNVFAFNGMIECFNGYEITMGTLEPYSADDIAWTCANILGIWGSDTFSFTGSVLRYIKACLEWNSWEMPPVFLAFPKILDMYETKELKMYQSISDYLAPLSLKHISELLKDKEAISLFRKTPFLFNYLIKNANKAKDLVNKINTTNNQLKTIFS